MKAIIAAAGWKGAGAEIGLAGCPEPFLPLGDGTTTLSRTATILSENGYEIYIAMCGRGYPYSSYIRWSAQKHLPQIENDFAWSDSPWTQERHDYAAQFGQVLEMPDPGGWSTSLDTFCVAMDMIGANNWDHLFLTCGDMFVPRDCLEYALTCTIPFVFSFTAYHVYFGLDGAGARFFREYTEPFRRYRSEESWYHDKNWGPNYWGVSELKKAGFNVYDRDDAPPHTWTDIDISSVYHKVRASVESEGICDR